MTNVDCVIAGGGPGGMMLGYLLARAGLRVTVLEKHADFLRDFRGDTIHPSTVSVLGELGLRERFLELPLSRISALDGVFDGHRMTVADFATLPSPDDFLVFAPQWNFLKLLADEASRLDGFELLMSTEATGLIFDGERVTGVRGTAGEIRATLTVAADGRGSTLRKAAGFEPNELGVPIDVLWFHLPKPSNAPPPTLAYVGSNGIVLTLDRGTYYQSGLIIPKDGWDALRAAGLPAFRANLAAIAPVLLPVVDALESWDQIKLLSVQIDSLDRWYREGFMCIGDAAHAMSPVGGVGVNYAIQDAVALANAIAAPLRGGQAPTEVLAAVQERRQRPVQRMQRIQQLAHERIARPTRVPPRPAVPPAAAVALRLLSPLVRRVVARVVGRGFLPEHVGPSVLEPR